MAAWFRYNLGDAMLEADALERLKTVLDEAYEKAGRPDDMAAFYRHESEGKLHCELIVYLTEATYARVKQLDAQPCQKPSPHGLSLLLGSEQAWSRCFAPEKP